MRPQSRSTNTSRRSYQDSLCREWLRQNRPDVLAAIKVAAVKKFPYSQPGDYGKHAIKALSDQTRRVLASLPR